MAKEFKAKTEFADWIRNLAMQIFCTVQHEPQPAWYILGGFYDNISIGQERFLYLNVFLI